MATPTNDAYQAKAPLTFRPRTTTDQPGRPIPLSNLEELAAGTVVGAASAGAPVALTIGATLAVSGTTLNIADGSKGGIVISSGGTVFTPSDSSVTEAMQVLADNTTQDVSTTKHGYVPKAPNDTTKFLRGDATWAVPTGGLTQPQVMARGLGA